MRVRNLGRKSLVEIRNTLKKLGFGISFQLIASGICDVAQEWLAKNTAAHLSCSLKERLSELDCDVSSVYDIYTVYNEQNRSLPFEERLVKFVLGYYYSHSKHSIANVSKDPNICENIFDWTDKLLDADDGKDLDEDVDTLVKDITGPHNVSVQPTALTALERMTGLRRVKEMVHDISAHCVISKMKQEAGAKEQIFVPNALFLGNPGTGKTTVAKIMAQLYKEIGLIKKGHLVTAEQSDLIGKYLGQTAPKVKEVFKSALGGVLFVDEAYMLGENDIYGKEAVATLANMMTEYKGQCCIILAGYEEQMNRMIRETNPGLRERFPFKLIFDDYNPEEIMEIFMSKLDDSKLRISGEGRDIVFGVINKLYETRNEEFANARVAENIFQEVALQQERRLFRVLRTSGSTFTARSLFSITKADCKLACERITAPARDPFQGKRTIGFLAG